MPTSLGGGLNNMLMHLSQLLADNCTLELSQIRLNTGDQFFRRSRRGEEPPTHAVSDLFDLPPTLHAPAHGSRGCTRGLLADGAPQSALPPLVSINHKWYRERRYTRALTSVYAQLRAAPRLERMVDAYLAEVGARHGSGSWACIHLRLERDWVNTAAMCNRPEGRYCWSPEQARHAAFTPRVVFLRTLTRMPQVLSRLPAADRSRVVLVMSTRNTPAPTAARVRATFPTAMYAPEPANLTYSERAALHLFIAARAASFWGNTFSTFSRGVAALRDARGLISNAYDCAHVDLAPSSGHRASPAFRMLRPPPREQCAPRGTAADDEWRRGRGAGRGVASPRGRGPRPRWPPGRGGSSGAAPPGAARAVPYGARPPRARRQRRAPPAPSEA